MKRILLEKLNNTRDLGGIEVPGGTIAPGRLIRSGQPGRASEADLEWIAANVSTVIDFRTPMERGEVPDPDIKGVENIHLPIVDDLTAGVSRDAQSDEEAIHMLLEDPNSAKEYMSDMYRTFVESEKARDGYEAFVNKLFEDRDKAILWHCTAGKDRAGFATVIALEMLGADRGTIMENYLATNDYIEADIEGMVNFFFGRAGGANADAERALRYLFGAHREFLEAAYASAEELYGSISGYIRDGLHVDDAAIESWKKSVISPR